VPLEKILDKILEDADAEAASLLENASVEAGATLKKAQDEAESAKRLVIKDAESMARAETDRAYTSKNLEIRKELLRKKRELMDEAFEKALKALFKLDDKKYLGLIERAILESVSAKEEAEVLVFKGDRARVDAGFIDAVNKKGHTKLGLGPAVDRDDRGVIIKRDKVLTDLTFSTALNMVKDRIEFGVAKILFG
jgi:V/A-type H+-transporting ATPase subunit E